METHYTAALPTSRMAVSWRTGAGVQLLGGGCLKFDRSSRAAAAIAHEAVQPEPYEVVYFEVWCP